MAVGRGDGHAHYPLAQRTVSGAQRTVGRAHCPQQQQQQQQQREREQQPAPVIDLRVAHAMAMQSSPSACDGSKKEAETERLRVI